MGFESDIQILPGDPDVEIVLRRSARARRITLRVSRRDGRVTLTLPASASVGEAMDFARSREAWVRSQLAEVVPAEVVAVGGQIPIDGTPCRIVAADAGRSVRHFDGQLHLPKRAVARPGPAIAGYLKGLARDRMVGASDLYADRVGRAYGRISLRDTRSRWGSCSSEGNLMYSWRLVMAPTEVQNYVAAHEVAHLVEMNHSAQFWAVVERLMPDYAVHRRWLRDHGGALQAIDFAGQD